MVSSLALQLAVDFCNKTASLCPAKLATSRTNSCCLFIVVNVIDIGGGTFNLRTENYQNGPEGPVLDLL